MRVKPIPAFALAGENTTGRSPGLHASDLYGKLFQQLDPKRYPKNEPMDWNRIALGLAWEQYLEKRMQVLGLDMARPGEFQSPHGFYYTPDLFSTSGKFRLGEIKVTWMSCRGWPKTQTNNLPPQFDKYLSQMMLYCHERETPYATLYPYFVRGNYKGRNDPQFLPVDIEFSARELRDNFSRLMNFGRNEGML